MAQTLLTLELGTRQDVAAARQRARQIAALLGYPAHEQTSLAVAVFFLAHQEWEDAPDGRLVFVLDEGFFEVAPQETADPLPTASLPTADGWPAGSTADRWKLRRPLPDRPCCLPGEDLAWSIQQLHKHTPLDWFDEVRQHNQEMLALLRELAAAEAELRQSRLGASPAA